MTAATESASPGADPSPPSRVAVLSRSFSRNPILRSELQHHFPHAKFNDTGRTLADEELIEFTSGYDGLVVALERMDAAALARMPDLKVLSKYGVGLDNLDLKAAAIRGIRVGWSGGVNRRSVAELTVAMMISTLRFLPELTREVRGGTWRQKPGRELSGRPVGILGCGHVGQEVAKLLSAFGCRISIHDTRDLGAFCTAYDVRQVDIETLFRTSEILTIHLPVTPSTSQLVGPRLLDLMPEQAVLVNCARGGIVEEAELKTRLKSGKIAGAAFDVFASEPPTDEELLALPNFMATPHIGGSTEEAVLAMGRAAIKGLFDASNPLDTDYIPVWCR